MCYVPGPPLRPSAARRDGYVPLGSCKPRLTAPRAIKTLEELRCPGEGAKELIF